MSEFIYERDTWFAPLPIDSTNNTVVFSDSSVTNEVIDLDLVDGSSNPISYYNMVGTGSAGSRTTATGDNFYPLLDRIEAAINAASSNAYEFQAFTPTGYLAEVGVKLVQTSGSGGFSWDFSDGSWSLDPRILGFPASQTADVSSSAGELEGDFSTYGVWVSHTITDGEATRKLQRRTKNVSLSSEDVRYATRKQYYARDYRQFVYEYVPGAHVRENRGFDADSAATASIAEDDVNQAFYGIWDLATRQAEAASSTRDIEVGQLAPIIVLHDTVDVLGETSSPLEVLLLSNEGQIRDFDECIDVMRVAGEYYRLTVDTLILSGNYGQ